MNVLDAEQRAHRHVHRMSIIGLPADHEEYAALQERYRFFRVYMIGRAAPMGGGARLAHAATALFPYGLVENAFRRVAEDGGVDELRQATIEACVAAADRIFGEADKADELADLLERLVGGLDFAARPLAGAWADLPRPDGVGARIERAATVLREHRGGGHVSVLTTHGLVGVDALLLTACWRGDDDVEGNARFFGWRDEDISTAWARLEASGRVDADHRITDTGREERDAIEELTEAIAAERWFALEPDERVRAVELLEAAPTAR